MKFLTIGFLGIYRFEEGAAIRGAILITDTETKPLEFRVTGPVRPQKFQEILYGELLNEHISVELIGLPLLSALQQKPNLIIVRDILFLEINTKQEIPTVLMLKEDEALLKRGASTKPLNPEDSGRPPVKICTLSQFEPKLEEISHLLQPIFLNRDLMEPFNRLEKACADFNSRNEGNN
ncbi:MULTISPECIES: hypothetical protein [unclassified Microcoleus]|uniref:hypothetical protein n=1 Tax=unclassified Microcoleus TaxID=2642155 RepID=UPI002FCEA88C